ncbi:trans-aconitate 2-methyltransferase, putative [Talaromyces stipitatus ATCC 10500]|uniref:Trans-aconitate 2-methyltransferase, putative n=1 Tax=Talaromyces stipitatus (strain ATCC 10500 / CBS 375.48 / QM 6759 / NRRL 1006) TaxID=441959 RepID=B8MIY9_TALSN|nr:trans-aconitate 2-methyltransferase, putative [Talaromyces stipitatus ATCC 10500]EED15651.1 trans-aconitate 2-methyltransferase, putative [Talaromyces stipitatus ATCC 10500]
MSPKGDRQSIKKLRKSDISASPPRLARPSRLMRFISSSSVLYRHRLGTSITKAEGFPAFRQAFRTALSPPKQQKQHLVRMSSTDTNTGYRQAKDWNATQYLKFEQERTRPVHDLLAQIPISSPRRVVDLGCGPGNSTEVLAARWPNAQVSGMDSSPDMIEKARGRLPDTKFELGDLNTWAPTDNKEKVDVFFSNAVFQWVPSEKRLPLIARFIEMQAPGGVFAFQVPDNFLEPSHAMMRETASDADKPWFPVLQNRQPALARFQSTQEIYDALIPLCRSLNIWHTHYYHILESHEAVVEWVKGTGLRPFIDPLSEEDKKGFVAAYLERLKKVYSVSVDGRVLYKFPRLFVVAVRK